MEIESITSNSYPITRTIEADVVIGLHYDIPPPPTTTTTTTSHHVHATHIKETVAELLQSARQDGYKYITCRIPENISMINMNTSTSNSVDDDYHSLTTMESDDWRTSIVGVMTIPNMTSINNTTTTATPTTTTTIMMLMMTKLKDHLISSIGWCLHMNIPAIILPSFDAIHSMIRTSTITTLQQRSLDMDEMQSMMMMMMIRQYANIVLSCLIHTNVRDLQIWIPHIMSSSSTSNSDSMSTLQCFHQLVDYHPSIRTLYTLSSIMNTKSTTQKQQQQSYALLQHYIQQIHIDIGSLPPIAAIQIPTTLFNQNVRGFPTLKRIHQQCFIQFYRRFGRNLKLLLTQTIPLQEHTQMYSHLHTTQLGATQLLPHYQYIRHLRNSKLEITSILDGTIVNTTTTTNNDENNNNNSDTTNKVSKIRTLELQYNDVLQSPLQPLADHLENYTYEIFEHDPIKYVQYETAIYHTMYDYYMQLLAQYQRLERTSTVPTTIHLDTSTISSSLCSTGSSNDNPPLSTPSSMSTTKKGIAIIPYIVLVVGAGRGPLVTCTMKAYEALLKTLKSTTTNNNDNETGFQLQLYVYAVEKNPNAILYLQSKFRKWIHSDNVVLPKKDDSSIHLQIVHSDLRYLNANTLFQNIVQQQSTTVIPTPTTTSVSPPLPPSVTASYKANLIVSELLGSFGCNELSPECLDTLLHRTNVCSNTMTKSIPYRYTSHVAPISSMQLYQNVKQQALYPTCTHSTQQQMIGLLKAFETPYVVRPYMVSQIYTTQDCWSFTHTPSSSLNGSVSHATTSVSDIHRDLERYVHLEFGTNDNKNHVTTTQSLPFMYGAQYGTGYGPCDEYVESTMMMMEHQKSSKKNSNKSSSNNNTSTVGEQHYHHQTVLEPQQQQSAWTCTGLLGTFTADLYPSSHSTNTTNTNESTTSGNGPSIQISTNPDTFSTGMFSWFPLYFPSHQPIQVPKLGIVHVDIWRKCTTTKVWYEWMFTVVVESPSKSNDNSRTTLTTTNSDNNNIKGDNNINDNHVNMEMDDDRIHSTNKTNDHDHPLNSISSSTTSTTTTIHYVSPIHNPGGRSSYVSLLS